MMAPSRTRTQPTWGLGEARPVVARARSRARSMKTRSSGVGVPGLLDFVAIVYQSTSILGFQRIMKKSEEGVCVKFEVRAIVATQGSNHPDYIGDRRGFHRQLFEKC